MWIEPYRFSEVRECLTHMAGTQRQPAQSVVRVRVVGIQLEGVAKLAAGRLPAGRT